MRLLKIKSKEGLGEGMTRNEYSGTYEENYRPQFHFSPQMNWMNDPNGMVFYEGEYHLFYQYHPHSTIWGPMHWGHAISKNMVEWEHFPIALEPDEHGVIYSGSVVVDRKDTSGFFNGESGLVAIYTNTDKYPESEKSRQRQSIAYSSDRGRSWVKYEGNPVLIDESIIDFRDPKVFWHEATCKWVMVIAAKDRVRFYTSPDLKSWTFASDFGAEDGSHLGVWECPDLFELTVDGDNNNKQVVLIVSIGGNPAYSEGSRTQYFIGSFNGTHFVNRNAPETVLWLDFGRDNYAGVSWSDIPEEDGRRIYLGWMSNWKYARVTPTEVWRSAMTIPRELKLKSTEEGIRVYQTPIVELQQLRKDKHFFENVTIGDGCDVLKEIEDDVLEIIAEFELGSANEFGLKVRKSEMEETVVGYDSEQKSIFVDRSSSGVTDFFEFFAGKHEASLQPLVKKVRMHIFIDRSSVEVFGNEGEVAITEQIFPDASSRALELYAKGGSATLVSMEVYTLDSIWRRKI